MTEMDTSSTVLNVNSFLEALSGSAWGMRASTDSIDDLFQCALHLQENTAPELTSKYPGVNFNKSTDLLLENIIKNQHINENLTSYAIDKYLKFSSSENLSALVENIMCEVKLRENLFSLIDEFPNVDLNFGKMDRLLQDLDNPNWDSTMVNAVKFETSVLLCALEHCSDLTRPVLFNKLISCLESQSDLRLWFSLFKNEHLETVIKLCSKYKSLLDAVFVFFDKLADEIESTYDEDLNVKYSHVNLDFEDLVQIFQFLLKEKSLCKTVEGYLDGKTILDKNYCFWIDLKSCLES